MILLLPPLSRALSLSLWSQNIVQCWGFTWSVLPQLYTLLTEDTVRIGNPFYYNPRT
jgi:hypothetical protein